jgi:hypothetical protein
MKIFVWTPAANTGGPEALHQLADSCTRQGMECYLFYPDNRRQVAPPFACYTHLQIADRISDDADCVVVLPELCTPMVPMFRQARVVFWWLSVDNNRGQFTDFQNQRIVHAYQSEYARLYLEARGCARSYPLFDYINDSYRLHTAPCGEKLNLIAFNAQKGLEITRHLIPPLCHAYGFAPLAGLNRPQVKELLLRSRVYLDFGHHPGKDRGPREAALMRNCIVVAHLGAARNLTDVPIPRQYKIDIDVRHSPDGTQTTLQFNRDATCAFVDTIMNDYDSHLRKFEAYVERIRQEKEEFDRQVGDLFGGLAAGREF